MKGRYPWNYAVKQKAKTKKKKFETANFSASDRLRRIFPTVENGLEKRKNLYLIKLVSKGI